MEDRSGLPASEVDVYYKRLVSSYWTQMYAFILRRTGSPQDTEDIVQEAFIHAYYALERYSLQQVSSLRARPWLYKITWNVYCNYMRRARPPQAVSLDTVSADLLFDVEDEEQEQPEAVFERGERWYELRALVSRLPEPYREVIGLYYFDEFSYQEIADLLNRPLGTIKTHVYRGLKMLRKEFQSQGERSIK